MWEEYILLFLLGAGMGSAGNALIDRLPRNESWIKGRSHCDKCKHVLRWRDLIPVVSYLWLGGKCRYCHFPIPVRNLLVEIFMGVMMILNFKFLIFKQFLIIQFLIVWVTMVIAVMDWETKMVSEIMIALWTILVISWQFSVISWQGTLVGILVIGGLWAVTRGKAMGFGDVEIAAVMGLSLGWPKIGVGLWLAFVIGALYGVVLMIRKKAKLKSVVAFGPFLIIGYWAAKFWGDILIKYTLGI